MSAIFSHPQLVGALIALSGASLGFFASLARDIIRNHYEDRRHLRQLAIESAIEYWKQDFEVLKLAGQLTGKTVYTTPLDTYIVHMILLAELISRKKLTAENVGVELAAITAVSKAALESVKKKKDK